MDARHKFLAILIGWACISSPGAAAAGEEHPWYAGRARLSLGADFRSGDFGRASETNLFAASLSLAYQFEELVLSDGDRLRVGLSLPYLFVDGPDRGENDPVGGLGVDHGLGDLTAELAYLYAPPSRLWPHLEVEGRLKIPTASEENDLGTGELDFTLEGTLARPFAFTDVVQVTPFASFGHKWVGGGALRENALRAGAGTSLRVHRRLSFGGRYAWRESTVEGRGDRHEAIPFLSFRATRSVRLTPYGVIGLSERAADWGVGFRLTVERRVR